MTASARADASGEPVAIVGAGAVGMVLGAALARAGHPLTVCGGRPRDRITVVDGAETTTWPVTHTTDPGDIAGHRLVVVAVKAHQTDAVGAWLRAAASSDTTVVVAQNGVEQRERVAPFVGDSFVVPAVIYAPVDRPAVDRAVLTRPAGPDLAVPDDDAALAVAARLRAGGLRVDAVTDFVTAAWAKLVINSVSGPLTTLTGRRLEVLRDPAIAAVALRVLAESASVARADGAAIDGEEPQRALRWLQELPDGSTTSMLQDREAGRMLEYEALTGAVVRRAERHRLDVPANRMIFALLAVLETRVG